MSIRISYTLGVVLLLTLSSLAHAGQPMPKLIIAPALAGDGTVFSKAKPLGKVLRKAAAKTKKFALVSPREVEKLGRLYGGPYAAGAADVVDCAPGHGLSDHLLMGTVVSKKGGKRVLDLRLISVENGCTIAHAQAKVGWDGFAAAAETGVFRLARGLKGVTRTKVKASPEPVPAPSVKEAKRVEPVADEPASTPSNKAVKVITAEDEAALARLAKSAPADGKGALAVKVEDEKGNPVRATVLLDGRKLDSTPYVGKVAVGKHVLEIRAPGYQAAQTSVVVQKTNVTALTVVLTEDRAR
jgi:hypothetical protein